MHLYHFTPLTFILIFVYASFLFIYFGKVKSIYLSNLFELENSILILYKNLFPLWIKVKFSMNEWKKFVFFWSMFLYLCSFFFFCLDLVWFGLQRELNFFFCKYKWLKLFTFELCVSCCFFFCPLYVTLLFIFSLTLFLSCSLYLSFGYNVFIKHFIL